MSRRQEWSSLVEQSSIGKHLDDPQHLGKFQKDLSTKASESNHVLLFWDMNKILVHHYNFLLST